MKTTFASKTFGSRTFASGTWAGVGVDVAQPTDGEIVRARRLKRIARARQLSRIARARAN